MYKNEFKGKRILVTGGTGSIGSVIVKELLKYEPKQIRVYSRDESKQFELIHDLGVSPKLVNFLIGDIRDESRLNMAMENINIVFHAAALKHVSSCERNPFEAVKTNVQGTQNVINCAYANKVDKVVMISTDKATNSASVMGCTKLLAEKLILSSYLYKGNKKTKFCCVRFGNVLASRGSVVPLFIDQIKKGKPVTVTDPKMTRFMMAISDAVQLSFKAVRQMKNSEIFVLKMPVVNLQDLAQAVMEAYQEKHAIKIEHPMKVIGKKEGERVHEKLLTIEESDIALESDEMFIILPNLLNPGYGYEYLNKSLKLYPSSRKVKPGHYSSEDAPKMSVAQIKELLLSNEDIRW